MIPWRKAPGDRLHSQVVADRRKTVPESSCLVTANVDLGEVLADEQAATEETWVAQKDAVRTRSDEVLADPGPDPPQPKSSTVLPLKAAAGRCASRRVVACGRSSDTGCQLILIDASAGGRLSRLAVIGIPRRSSVASGPMSAARMCRRLVAGFGTASTKWTASPFPRRRAFAASAVRTPWDGWTVCSKLPSVRPAP